MRSRSSGVAIEGRLGARCSMGGPPLCPIGAGLDQKGGRSGTFSDMTEPPSPTLADLRVRSRVVVTKLPADQRRIYPAIRPTNLTE